MDSRAGINFARLEPHAGHVGSMGRAPGLSRRIGRHVAEGAVVPLEPGRAADSLPDDLTLVRELPFLTLPEQLLLGRLQTRTHGRMLAALTDREGGPWVTLALACHAQRLPGDRAGNVTECRKRLRSMSATALEQGIDALVRWVCSTDQVLQAQASADAEVFLEQCRKPFLSHQRERVHAVVRKAYRWQWVESGMLHRNFVGSLAALATREQQARVWRVLGPPTVTSR